ncbi:MAG: phosphate acyltransferase PlsX [Desulfotomaculaceae bacterium]|nr:phosphate acyltransferase PlsX [Desulfotomaculaceae bacterium]
MRIAVDVMGGDFAPVEIIKGALQAVEEYGLAIDLVGDEEQVYAELDKYDAGDLVRVVHAPEVIEMRDHPAVAVRRKKNSSIVKATQLVKDGAAQAVVSAGSTGASMTSALLSLGRIKGIDRPAIAIVLPGEDGFTLLLDIGANVDCKPHNLLQFGMMGSLYARQILGVANPKVGLLSNGEEETKGDEVTLAAFPLLANAGINFIGNVEGRDIYRSVVDVLVCDGFVGNILLKAGEGLAEFLFKIMKEEVAKSLLSLNAGGTMTGVALEGIQKRIEYAEYGGAPLLGVNGVSVVCHGRSTAKAIKNAIRVAKEAVDNNLVSAIRESIRIAEKKEVGCTDAQGSA